MAILMRRGNYEDFDSSRMAEGEFAVCLDNGYVFITLRNHQVIRLGTADTIEDALAQALEYAQSASDSADSASGSATTANANAENAEAWAVGQRDGEDVPTTDDTYHNNSKYYAEQSQYFSENATYLYIRYSENADGTGFVTVPTQDTIYIGVYTGNSQTAPTTKESYSWVRFIGRDGDNTPAMATLTDVALSSLQNGQILKYNSTTGKWENVDADFELQPATESTLGGIKVGNNLTVTADGTLSATSSVSDLGDLGDVNITDATTGNILKYNGTEWVNDDTPVSLPIASSSILGGIKVGSSLFINASTGVLNQISSGVAIGDYGETGGSSRTLNFGGAFYVPAYSVNGTGHLTASSTKTLYLPTLPKANENQLGIVGYNKLRYSLSSSISIPSNSYVKIAFADTSSSITRDYTFAENSPRTLLGASNFVLAFPNLSTTGSDRNLSVEYVDGGSSTSSNIYVYNGNTTNYSFRNITFAFIFS